MKEIIRNLFNFIIQKFRALSSAIRRVFMPDYLSGKAEISLKKALNKAFSVKPRDKDDYYRTRKYLVSKRLISLIIFVLGIIGLYYFFFINPIHELGGKKENVRIYSYKSIPLRFVNDTVKIKAKSGYIAYYGEVKDGKAQGKGILYRKNGEMEYAGSFVNNEYSGEGTLYRNGEIPLYEGEFQHNLYEGEGILYRENGSMEYEGEFHQGKKNGTGKLYDSSSNLVYNGNFQMDSIMYADFLGKSTAEAGTLYTGKRTIYYDKDLFLTEMKDIDACYVGKRNEDYLDESVQIENIYIKQSECMMGGTMLHSLEELKELFGNPAFEGYSGITLPEAVILGEKLEVSEDFADVSEVIGYGRDRELYLTMYEYNDLQYTFYSEDKTGGFLMYSIEK